MAAYSVADARNARPRLLDRALNGEDVVVTRHREPACTSSLRPSAG